MALNVRAVTKYGVACTMAPFIQVQFMGVRIPFQNSLFINPEIEIISIKRQARSQATQTTSKVRNVGKNTPKGITMYIQAPARKNVRVNPITGRDRV